MKKEISAFTTAAIGSALISFGWFWVDDLYGITPSPVRVAQALFVSLTGLGGPAIMMVNQIAGMWYAMRGRQRFVWDDDNQTSGRAVNPIWPDDTEIENMPRYGMTTQVNRRPKNLQVEYRLNGSHRRVMLPSFMTDEKLLQVAGPVQAGYDVVWRDLKDTAWTDVQYKSFLTWAMNPHHQFAAWKNEANERHGWRPVCMSFWKAAYHTVQNLEG